MNILLTIYLVSMIVAAVGMYKVKENYKSLCITETGYLFISALCILIPLLNTVVSLAVIHDALIKGEE